MHAAKDPRTRRGLKVFKATSIPVAIVAVGATFAVVGDRGGAADTTGGTQAVLARISSAQATPQPPPDDVVAVMRRMGRQDITMTVLGRHHGRAYYRLEAAAGETPATCFGVGPAGGQPSLLGRVKCAHGFPSAARPVLDFSIVTGRLTPDLSSIREEALERAEGIVADGVASVALVDDRGAVVARANVIDNSYYFDSLPRGRAAGLLALDGNGRVVGTQLQPRLARP